MHSKKGFNAMPADLEKGITRNGTGHAGKTWNILGQIYFPKAVCESTFAFETNSEPGQFVPAETLLLAYAADRERADKTYKGVRLSLRGTVGAFRPDPADNRNYTVFLNKGVNSGWIACLFNTGNLRFREEKQFNTSFLVIMDRNEIVARVQAGQTLDIQGTCDGFEDTVRLSKCEIVR